MTRLQRDAVKTLVVAAVAAAAMGVLYAWTRNPVMSLLGLGIIGLAGFLDLFRSAEPGPVMDKQDVASRPRRSRWWMQFAWLLVVLCILEIVYVRAYAGKPGREVLLWVPAAVLAISGSLSIWVHWRTAGLRQRVPRYDERERLVLLHGGITAFGVFWMAFVLWGLVAGVLCESGAWRLPGYMYLLQTLAGLWLFFVTYSLSVVWQEWRAGR